jgi:8-oxo-dGTP diphosphatase
MTSMRETNLSYTGDEHSVHGTWLSVDVLALTDDTPSARLVLIERHGDPHRGETTLPGGLLAGWHGETVEEAAIRVVREKTGLEPVSGVAVLDVVSDPHRDERGHTVSVVTALRVGGGVLGSVLPSELPDMPFGHTAMARHALERLERQLLVDPDVTYALLGDETTYREVFSVLGACHRIGDNAARARLDRSPLYRATTKTRPSNGVGRPLRVYRRV